MTTAPPDLAFERMTIFVADMERSLAFYRDALGLVVVEDKTVEGPAVGALLQLPPCKLRICFLAPDAEAPMVLGLFEIGDTPVETLAPERGRPMKGQTSLLLRTTQFDAVHARLEAAGTSFLTLPTHYTRRVSSDRSPAGVYREMIAYDPDGVLLAVFQLDPLAEG